MKIGFLLFGICSGVSAPVVASSEFLMIEANTSDSSKFYSHMETYLHCFNSKKCASYYCISNQVARELARLAKYSSPSIWMDSPPDEVVPLVVHDVTLLTE